MTAANAPLIEALEGMIFVFEEGMQDELVPDICAAWLKDAIKALREIRSPAVEAPSRRAEGVLPEFAIEEDGDFSIEWCGGRASVLVVTFDGEHVRFSAATAPGVTCSGKWVVGEVPPQSFVDTYRAVALNAPPAPAKDAGGVNE